MTINALQRKKILYLITKSNWGGAQRYVYDIAAALPKDRFDVVVALGGDGPLKTNLEEAGIRVIQIPGLQRDISFAKELQSFGAIWKIVKAEQPDVFHVNSSKAGGLGALIGRLQNVPKIIYSAHGWAFNEERSPLSKLVVGFFHWLTVMLAHKTIAVSSATKAQMKWPFTQRKIVVVHNGRETPAFLAKEAARAACAAANDALLNHMNDVWTGTIAELHPVKLHEVMLEAIAQLVAEGTQVRHVIVGTGELEATLKAKISELKLEDHVFLVGQIHEAARILRAFDIYVQPSRSESLGYTVIEAAQAARAIVATKVGGIPEIITDGWDGILVKPNNTDDLATAVGALIDDAARREKMAHAAGVRGQHFSLERMVVDTTAVYN